VGNRELEVENVPVKTFDRAAGQSPASILRQVLLEYPDAIVVPDVVDAASAAILLDQAVEDRIVVAAIRAKETAETPLRLMQLGVPAAQLAPVLSAVVNQRLVRKLCTTCRVAYAPPPAVLQRLGIPADRAEAFYRPPPPTTDAKQVCPDCLGLGYRGRIGVFEVMIVDDGVREALMKNPPQIAEIRAAARKAGMQPLQKEALVHVIKGTTSLEELRRVFEEK
jgi:type II secretory ATPase GspE/PulE/Tfp pilus assembly ATPase PilB-like protein